jgi:hypothetical protein
MSRTLKVGVAVVIILVLAGGVLAVRRAGADTIDVPMAFGAVHLHFDPRTISGEYLGELAVLSPHVSWTFAPPAWDECVSSDGEEHECEAIVLDGPDLFEAEAELSRAEDMLATIRRLRVPPQLDAVLAHVHREAAFHLCLWRAELAYYRGDDYALWVACDDVDAAATCQEVVVQGPLTRVPEARYRLAAYTWRGCMSDRFQQRFRPYPMDGWREFLRAYGVEEEVFYGC